MPGLTVNAVHPLSLGLVSSMRRQQRHKVGTGKEQSQFIFQVKKRKCTSGPCAIYISPGCLTFGTIGLVLKCTMFFKTMTSIRANFYWAKLQSIHEFAEKPPGLLCSAWKVMKSILEEWLHEGKKFVHPLIACFIAPCPTQQLQNENMCGFSGFVVVIFHVEICEERASNTTTHKNAHFWGCGCGLLAVTIGL